MKSSGELSTVLERELPYLGPLLVWMAVIAVLSSDFGSSARTTDPVIRLIQKLLLGGHARPETQLLLDTLLRKSAHLFEYVVLAFLACRWLHFQFPLPGFTLAAGGTAFAGLYACLDEWHQLFVRSRSGSAWDVAIDLAGAAIGAALFSWLRGRAFG